MYHSLTLAAVNHNQHLPFFDAIASANPDLQHASHDFAGQRNSNHRPYCSGQLEDLSDVAQKNLIYSSDSGKHWDGKELNFASAGNLHLHRVDDSTLFITTSMGLYLSHDAGRNWNRQDVRDLQFQDLAASGNSMVAALQKHGLIASFDAGKSWQRLNDPVAEGYFPVLQSRRNGSLVAASATEGILTMESGARSAEGVGSSALMPGEKTQKPR